MNLLPGSPPPVHTPRSTGRKALVVLAWSAAVAWLVVAWLVAAIGLLTMCALHYEGDPISTELVVRTQGPLVATGLLVTGAIVRWRYKVGRARGVTSTP